MVVVVSVQEEVVLNIIGECDGVKLDVLWFNVEFFGKVVDELDFFCKVFSKFIFRGVQ